MDPAMLAEAARRFPLIGRPRVACPALHLRITEVAALAARARQDNANGLATCIDVLNRAALIASDCGMRDLARDLCWQHIDVYRALPRPLTASHARFMLEPVFNLARLHMRAGDTEQALRLLTAMCEAMTTRTDLVVDAEVLPLADVAGSDHEQGELRRRVWLYLLEGGVRALARAGRWDAAVALAQSHRGVGLHLMEGRQVVIIAHLFNSDREAARAALAESTPTESWEDQVAACLNVMCHPTETTQPRQDITAMVGRFIEHEPLPGYVAYRVQLGLTVATLAVVSDPDAAGRVLTRAADEAIQADDGYAARDLLLYDLASSLIGGCVEALTDIVVASGLGCAVPDPLLHNLLDSTRTAVARLRAMLTAGQGHVDALAAQSPQRHFKSADQRKVH